MGLCPQVWYLSGWVCYLQLVKAKEQQQSEGRDVTAEEEQEWKALTDAARTHLTCAKKVRNTRRNSRKEAGGRRQESCTPGMKQSSKKDA